MWQIICVVWIAILILKSLDYCKDVELALILFPLWFTPIMVGTAAIVYYCIHML